MAEHRAERVRANVWKIAKGKYGLWLVTAAAGAMFSLIAIVTALVRPDLRPIAVLLALGNVVLALFIIVALLARSSGLLLELAANVSLQSQLTRSGFAATDFFVDGAAGSATLQLFLTKVLNLCKPHTVLELGSGQTTKVLTHYARSNRDVEVLTIEENGDWHQQLSAVLGAPPNHRYCYSRLEPRDVVLPKGHGVASTSWYGDVDGLLAGRQFQLILVDGPTNSRRGDEFVRYSRSGLIPYLPALLAPSFVILIDDTDNYGYLQTARAMRQALEDHGRAVYAFDVHGVKSQTILCSSDWQFLRSV